MKNEIKITADDFGLTRGITDSILEAVDLRAVNSVSILANGGAVEYAISEYKKRKDKLKIAVHLNLTEGPSLSPRKHTSFVTLWFRYIFASPKKKEIFRSYIKKEIESQIIKIKNLLGEDEVLSLDGHQHVHMLPFVFDEVLTLIKEYKISSIRIPNQPFFLNRSFGVYFGPNIIKHFLLKILSSFNQKKAKKAGIKTNDYLLGVLNTGKMTLDSVENGLKRISKIAPEGASIEIIFHPGVPSKGETIWGKPLETDPWHSSPWRAKEKELLKSTVLKEIINKMTFGGK